jgi:hypothetical protein
MTSEISNTTIQLKPPDRRFTIIEFQGRLILILILNILHP